ncbi:hypothetical protein M5K25_003502 [Dendrobium thyrsiflorum]|uniref:Uncharacterized protein n=1 Tax=Dendrobium thyrsiflorum TaxID=117978 RepID=A0ABD0VJ31_DENTH
MSFVELLSSLLPQPQLPVASPSAAYTVGKLFHFSANAASATDDEPNRSSRPPPPPQAPSPSSSTSHLPPPPSTPSQPC